MLRELCQNATSDEPDQNSLIFKTYLPPGELFWASSLSFLGEWAIMVIGHISKKLTGIEGEGPEQSG